MATTEQRLAEYEEAYKKAQAYNPTQFQSEFEKAYGEATGYNKDLIEQQAKALGEVQAVAPTLRQRYMNTLITDPTAQMALIAQARQAPITSYGTAANLLTARGQRYQDILGKALGGYQTSAEQANTAQENAWRLYQDAVQQEQFNQQLRRSGGVNLGDILIDRNGNGIPDIYERGTQQPDPRQGILNMIRDIAAERKSRNIEGATIDKYYQDILDTASRYNLRLNPEALWQRLGNTISVPQSLELFYR